MTLVFLLLAVLGLMALRVPVAFAFLLPSLAYIAFVPDLSILVVSQRVTEGVNSFVMLAVPLFILAGNLMNVSGITDRIYHLVQTSMGHVRGGMGYVNVAASVAFSGMSGSGVADAAGMGAIEHRAMTRHGYDPKFAVGITAGSAAIGPVLPPSIPAVIYGAAAGVSVGALFVAGIVPGLLMGVALCVYVFIYARRKGLSKSARASFSKVARAAVAAAPALLTPIVILGGILTGFFTPTEAAAVTVLYAAAISALAYRSLSLKDFLRVFVQTAETTGAILLIVGSALVFGWILSIERAPQLVAEAFISLTGNPLVFLLLVNVLLLIIGAVLEPTPAILILVPVLLPALDTYGIDPVHFGTIMILNLMIGMLTPPVGNILYVLTSVTRMSFSDVVSGTAPFLVPLLVTLLLVTVFPALCLFLPTVFGL